MKAMIFLFMLGGFSFNGLPTEIENADVPIDVPESRIVTMADEWTILTYQDFDDGADCTVYIYPNGRTWATGPDC